jgi:translation initiation factor 5B
VIDTPGHESFTNLRSRGSGLCDIAILVVDIMHGLEPQTIESINLLKMRKTPFVIALNKIDRCYGWNAIPNGPFLASLSAQKSDTQDEFEKRSQEALNLLSAQGLNCCLYYKNTNFSQYVSVIPTSAHTGEGKTCSTNIIFISSIFCFNDE